MRVLFIAEDESAAGLLPHLAHKGTLFVVIPRQGVSEVARVADAQNASVLISEDTSFIQQTIASFKPDITFHAPRFSNQSFGDKVVELKFGGGGEMNGERLPSKQIGQVVEGGGCPEAESIWAGATSSEVVWSWGQRRWSQTVTITAEETALSLRFKHVQAAAALFEEVFAEVLPAKNGNSETTNGVSNKRKRPASLGDEALAAIDALDASWEDNKVERYIRAKTFPPHDPAVAVVPGTGEQYFIENLNQWRKFKKKIGLSSPTMAAVGADGPQYAADTHWYSNVGGSIVKMEAPGADDLVNVADKRKLTVIPGALLGGSKAQKKLRMNEPIIGRNALRYCNSVLDSTWIGVEGPMVKRLERMLARICGCSQACAVQSGTAALYGAVKALGVGRREHHVICPTYTCAACADAVVHAGGTPIAVDCEMETFGLDLEAVRRALESDPQVVGVVVAPCYGVPMRDFLAIRELCHARGLWICEDNCESYGAMMRSEASSKALVPAGFLGDISVISVRSEKMVGVGEGGAILSRDPALVSKARWWCARAPCRGVGLWRVYDHEDVGQNYRLPEMLAAVGVAAAENLPVMIESKQRIHDMYKSAVMGATGGEGLTMQGSHPDERPVWWLNCIMIPEDSKFGAEDLGMQIMHDHPEVEIRPAFYPLHMMKPFMEKAQACPNAEQVYRRLLCVPSSGLLLDEDVRHVASCVIKAYASRRAGIVNGAH